MSNFNKVIIVGHIGAKPVLNITNTNRVPVCNLRIATNEGWTDKATGQKREKVEWHTVVCFNALAQNVVTYMDKGRQVLIEGRLQTREYMGAAKDANSNPIVYGNGQPVMCKKWATEIVANNVQFLGKNPNATAYTGGVAAPGVIVDPNVALAAGYVAQPVYAADPFMAPGAEVMPGAPVDPAAVAATFVTAQPVNTGAPAGTVLPAAATIPPGV